MIKIINTRQLSLLLSSSAPASTELNPATMATIANLNASSLPFLQSSSPLLSPRTHSLSFSRALGGCSSSSGAPLIWQHSSRRRVVGVSARAASLQKEKGNDSPSGGVRVTESREPHSSVKLKVEVPPQILQQCYQEALDEYARRAQVPGFRPGKKIPENILINYVGKQNVQQAAIEATLKKTLPEAVSSVEGRALKDTVRIATKLNEMNDSFSLQDAFRYEIVADLAPEVKWLSENKYKNLKVVVEIDNIIKAENAADIEFRRRHKALGALKIVTGRGLQMGDFVVLDILATTVGQDESEDKNIPATDRKGFQLDTEETYSLVPGFLDAIIGIQQGETRSFPLQFPESWEQENLRGVTAQFTVECKELFYRDLPELDDSIAEKLFPGCSTLNEVRETLLQKCKEVEQTAIEQATDNAILNELSKIVEVDIPKSLFEEQGRQLYGAKLLQLQADEKLSKNQLASFSSERAVNAFLKTEKESISMIIKQTLAAGEIFKSENLQFPTEELLEEVRKSVEEFKRQKQEYDEDHVKEQVQDVLEGAKVLEWLRENSQIEYVYK